MTTQFPLSMMIEHLKCDEEADYKRTIEFETIRVRIFESFFMSKEVSKATVWQIYSPLSDQQPAKETKETFRSISLLSS
jgi:hypothetical protein